MKNKLLKVACRYLVFLIWSGKIFGSTFLAVVMLQGLDCSCLMFWRAVSVNRIEACFGV
ncbi:MAG: hypothetical protein LBK06_07660 [Planctomycetaceae bacterium]|nr:hypothetical protein [Planctomycetaceae bacterium]